MVRHQYHSLSAFGIILFSRKFFTFFGGQHHLVEQKLHEKYGNVIRTGPNSLAFASLPAFEAVYGFNKSLEKGPFYDFARDAHTQAGSIFTARTDAIHREHKRKVVGAALLANKIATYEPTISRNVHTLVSRLTEAQSSSTTATDVCSFVHRYTLDTLMEIIYGQQAGCEPYTDTKQSRDVLPALQKLSKMAWGSSLLPWFGWLMSTRPMVYLTRLPTYDFEGNLTAIAALVKLGHELVFSQSELSLEGRQPSVLKNYLQVPESDTKRMDPEQMFRECFNLNLAGPGSTAAALTAIIYELGTHRGREWQNRICNDLKGGITGPIPSPVLMAVIKETMRLHAPFPTGFPRSIAPGAENAIPGLPAPLPVGTIVSSNTYILGHSKNNWGADAEIWKPQRWLEADESRKRKLEDDFVVFSKGPRGCIGKEIALLLIAKAVVGLLGKWSITTEGKLEGASFLEMQYTKCGIRLAERGEE